MDYQGTPIVLELEDDYTFAFLFESISVFPIFAKFNCHRMLHHGIEWVQKK